jgi:hypothetical protein
MKFKLVLLNLLFCSIVNGQGITKRALFLGNSYTFVNNLPQMLADVASSTGDSLLFDSNTPGGYRLKDHSTNTTSLAKIAMGNWDYVVLQEQSQLPALPILQVETDVFPYAHILDSIINAENSCAETVFYMTWGRKNGDASNCESWPPVCTYTGMDSLLNLRYRMMADSNNAIISPVGAVWKYIRQNFPLIDLYQIDDSHPSVAGTYAAACSFYAVLFRKDPSLITFNSTLSAIDAAKIRAAAKIIVYDSLIDWHIGEYDPLANFISSDSGGGQISFTNKSINATDYLWDFGDGTISVAINPIHIFTTAGTFNVKLLASKCGVFDSITQTIDIVTLGVQTQNSNKIYFNIYPNPTNHEINLKVNIELIGSFYGVYDNNGKIVMTGRINSENTIIGFEKLPGGIYLFNVGENLIRTLKVIKE